MRWQNIGADKNIRADKTLGLTKNFGADKMLAQMQKDPLTVWLGRVYSCWLLSGPAEDLLHLPDGVVALSACNCQVWCWSLAIRFYGRTFSPTVPACHTAPQCRKCPKLWRRQNISVRLKFTNFHQTIAVKISAPKRPVKKTVKVKNGQARLFCKLPPRASRSRSSWRSAVSSAGDLKWYDPAGGRGGGGERVEEKGARKL